MTLEEYKSKVSTDKGQIVADCNNIKTKISTLITDIESGLYFENTKKQETMIDKAKELDEALGQIITSLGEI